MVTEPGARAATRRTALRIAGQGAVVVGLTACGADGPSDASESGAPTPGPTGPDGTPMCVLTPEGTEGPFYLDTDLVRSELSEGRPGVSLRLSTRVLDAATCAPVPDAVVDVWHADATGIYSGVAREGTEGEHFLRGIQLTDEDGTVEFDTLYPGWYDRRTPHIHVKVHIDGDVVYTGQLYFAQELNDAVATVTPYAGRGDSETTNDNDMFSSSIGPETTMHITGTPEDGYDASIHLGVQR